MPNARLMVTSMMAFVQGCATSGTQSDPFTVEPADLATQIAVVAVAPVAMSAGVTVPDSTRAHIDSLVIGQFRGGGITVVDPAAYEALWAEVYESADPIFDSHTGERDEAAYQAAWADFYGKLATRYGATVVLFPEIWEVVADVVSGYATWDGASQNMASTGTHILAVLDAIFPSDNGGADILPYGYVEALSLNVVLEDATGAPLYTHRAGIESLRKRISSDRLAPSDVLQNWERLDDAVRRALGPVLDAYRNSALRSDDKTIAMPNR